MVHPFSVAIIQYLCNRYDLPEHWYPRKDIKAQAKVNEYLNWQHANTRMNCAMVFRHLVSRPGIVKYVETPGFLVAQLLWILCATLKKASSTNRYEKTHSFFIIHATKSIKLCSQETFLKIDNLRKIASPPPKKNIHDRWEANCYWWYDANEIKKMQNYCCFILLCRYMYIYCYIKMQLLTDSWLEREHYSALIFIWY